MPLKTSFCTIAYRKQEDLPLGAILEQVREAGYDGAEIWWPHAEKLDAVQLADVKAHAGNLGLAIPMLSPYLGNFNLEMTNRDEMIARTQASAPVAVALGAPVLRAFAGWTCECSSLTASEAYWKFNLDGFKEMARIAADHGLEIAIETHGRTLCDSVMGVRRFAEYCGARIKINLQLDDIAANSKLPDGVAVYRELKDLFVHAHIPAICDDAAKREDHAKLLAALEADGFARFVSIEHCKGAEDPFAVAKRGREWF